MTKRIEKVAVLGAGTMGARISGAGGDTIVVDGVDGLGGAVHRVIPDRIEGGTYLIGAAITGGDVLLEQANAADLAPLLDKLAEVGVEIEVSPAGIRARAGDGSLRARDVATAPHPGFPTDLQAQYMALMTRAAGTSTIRETVFENRFQHAPELARMGARVHVDGGSARVDGPTELTGAAVMATDLRASACLVLAPQAARAAYGTIFLAFRCVFVLSTFDTDHVLVRDEDVDQAVDARAAAGHVVSRD